MKQRAINKSKLPGEQLKRVKTVWRPGLRPRPRWGAYSFPRPLAGGRGMAAPPKNPIPLAVVRRQQGDVLRLDRKKILATALGLFATH